METNEVSDDLQSLVDACPPARELFERHGSKNFGVNINIANLLRSNGEPRGAIVFYSLAFEINKLSKQVLLAKLSTELEADLPLEATDLSTLNDLDTGYHQLIVAKRMQKEGLSASSILACLRNSHESFPTGSECDWIFLRAARSIVSTSRIQFSTVGQQLSSLDVIPRRLFFYWDKEPPKEVIDNIQYHKSLGVFEVLLFDKIMTREFLFESYGSDALRIFDALRHPSEESDFFRFHSIYSFGGYYLDTDDQMISPEAFFSNVSSSEEAVFILSNTGPVHSAFFGAVAGSPIIAEAMHILYHNCYFEPQLSMWLKTGPGPITRSISRHYYRSIFGKQILPSFSLLDDVAFPQTFRAVEMSYRGDNRDWRTFESARAGT